jgi:hypothetical protein
MMLMMLRARDANRSIVSPCVRPVDHRPSTSLESPTGSRTRRRAPIALELFFGWAVVRCTRIEGGQLQRNNQCAKNLVVRFATLQRSSIRRGKRIS